MASGSAMLARDLIGPAAARTIGAVDVGAQCMSHDSARSIATFADDAQRLPHEAFQERHGTVFLLRALLDGMLKPSPAITDRDAYKGTHKLPSLKNMLSARLGSPEATYVYAVGHLGREPCTIGRAPKSSVCIDDVSVSARHAELFRDETGKVFVTDAGSSNGTVVGGDAAPFAEAVEVPFGKSLVFGSVQLTLLPCNQFVDFVRLVTLD